MATTTTTTLNGKSFHIHVLPAPRVDANVREYTVEARRGQARATVGRVMGNSMGWAALRVGADAWTSWKPTRREAVAAMLAGRTFLVEQREAYTGATR